MKPYGWVALAVLILIAPSGAYAYWINGGPVPDAVLLALILINLVVGGICGVCIVNARDDWKADRR